LEQKPEEEKVAGMGWTSIAEAICKWLGFEAGSSFPRVFRGSIGKWGKSAKKWV
jgi:hypothetical protein